MNPRHLETFDLKPYTPLTDNLRSAIARGALEAMLQNPGDYRAVPLIEKELREYVTGTPYDTTDGIVLVGINDAGRPATEVMPPADRAKQEFLASCRKAVKPLQRPPEELGIDLGGLLLGQAAQLSDAKHAAVTGVSLLQDRQSGLGVAMLHVPTYFMHEGYDLVTKWNEGNESVTGLSREELSTVVAATLFDWHAEVSLMGMPRHFDPS